MTWTQPSEPAHVVLGELTQNRPLISSMYTHTNDINFYLL